jgi:succinoglycan biosynthesis protein ExoA
LTKKGISFVMAVRNEEQNLSKALQSIESQDLRVNWEIIIAVGPSNDRTWEIASAFSRANKNVTVTENPSGQTSAGLNIAVAASQFPIVIRVDGHSVLPSGYASLAQQVLIETGAANVGGVMRATGDGVVQSAIAFAYNSRIGLGGGSYHVGGKAGPSESVYLGCFAKEWLERVGGFDDKWIRGQDWELNLRIRQAGGIIWFDPRLQVEYRPRKKISDLGVQFFKTGKWRGALSRKSPGEISLRYLAPPLLVVGLLFGLPLLLYFLFLAFTAAAASSLTWRSRLTLVPVLATMHLTWGVGFWVGLFSGEG